MIFYFFLNYLCVRHSFDFENYYSQQSPSFKSLKNSSFLNFSTSESDYVPNDVKPVPIINRGANLTRFWTNHKRPRIAAILSYV